jgi:hypothetical protein
MSASVLMWMPYNVTSGSITSLLMCQNTLINLLFSTASVLLYAAFASAWLENVTSAASGSPSNETCNKTLSTADLHSPHIIVNTFNTNHCTHLNIYNLSKFGKVIIEVRDIVQTTWYFLQFQRAIVWVLVTWSQAIEVKTWLLCWLWRIFGLKKRE